MRDEDANSDTKLVLFDLDGTLADSAPDLAGALNNLRLEEGLEIVPIQKLRPYTSQGVRGLLKAGMNIEADDPRYSDFFERVLTYYAANICRETVLFPGIAQLLSDLENRAISWGIVTNKHSRFTVPLVAILGLEDRAACIVSGDTAARPKPAPDPLLHACQLTSTQAGACFYVGDDRRDIAAGHSAGMRTIATAWGYLGINDPIESWGADYIIQEPAEVLACLKQTR